MKRILFEPEHEAVRESARTFIAKAVVPQYPEWDLACIVPRELFTKAGDLGLFAAVPEDHGGAGVEDFLVSRNDGADTARKAQWQDRPATPCRPGHSTLPVLNVSNFMENR